MSREERLAHPGWMTRPPWNLTLRLLAPGDIRAPPSQLAAFRSFAHAGDPLAAAVAEMIARMPGRSGRRLFERALRDGIDDPPRELVELFAEVDAVPYWVDPDLLDRGARAVCRTGLLGLTMVMPCASLYGGYLASRANKTLVRTGDLNTMAPRRLAETASWWVDVTTPGGMGRFQAGFTNTLRVRVMHAQVRAAMHDRDDWDHDAWDSPINQIQLTGTLLLFSLVMLLASRALGLRFSRADRAAVLHLWRYVGHLMGVHPDLLPATEADAWRLLWLEAATEYMPDQDSQSLADSLMNAAAPLLLPPALKRSPVARRVLTTYLMSYSRLILGKRNADFLGAPDNRRYQAAVATVSAVVFAVETLRGAIPGATRLSERLGHRGRVALARRMIREQHGDVTHRRHDALHPSRGGGTVERAAADPGAL
ncbi:oxygenase MpaB family protein [Actinomadura rugatobispora]|uniref:Oxygenase MpaB family protein n=1 Tax=Actinomadura rugatobispora TaxID=1994 RepID=A0ABW1A2R0_9ACTN|nr:oxygenase MpaB family protein [Actinomadura rugatobispora]